jgi:roadblock/LC7 domain-containing protein
MRDFNMVQSPCGASRSGKNVKVDESEAKDVKNMATLEELLSKMNWIPQHGWMYAGGGWTVAIGGYRGVFVETAKADFNQLYRALAGSR